MTPDGGETARSPTAAQRPGQAVAAPVSGMAETPVAAAALGVAEPESATLATGRKPCTWKIGNGKAPPCTD